MDQEYFLTQSQQPRLPGTHHGQPLLASSTVWTHVRSLRATPTGKAESSVHIRLILGKLEHKDSWQEMCLKIILLRPSVHECYDSRNRKHTPYPSPQGLRPLHARSLGQVIPAWWLICMLTDLTVRVRINLSRRSCPAIRTVSQNEEVNLLWILLISPRK